MPENTAIALKEGTTSIGKDAFNGCTGLTSIEIPDNVTSIGDDAFSGCTGLTAVEIPNSVESIGDLAFSGCTGLTTVEIPDSVTDIGYNAFEETPWYNNLPDGLIYIGKVAYKYKGTMPENTAIALKEGTTTIGKDAFNDCTGLTSIEIPDSVKCIGDGAFYVCKGLTAINIPDSVTDIGWDAFSFCSGLTAIEIPHSVTFIGWDAFSYCSGLMSINVEDGNLMYDSRNNCNAIIETATNRLIAGCKNTIIPSSVTDIGRNSFWGCSELTSLDIPDSVTDISWDAFIGCSGLKSIHCKCSVPPAIDFYDYNSDRDEDNINSTATLYVPKGSLEAYETSDDWKEFENIVEE
jgi:hypothetical protein